MIKNNVMGFVYGTALGLCGVPFTDWRFWVLLSLSVFWAVIVNAERSHEP